MEETRNFVQLRGTAAGEPEPSHENHGQRFYRFPFAVRRLSGQTDNLWVIATGDQLRCLGTLTGKRLSVDGQLRSFNNKSGYGSKLVISVFAQAIFPTEEGDLNNIQLRGVICKPPVLRRTPLGRCISDMMLAVNRRYGRADYLPCIAWGQVAMLTGRMEVGEVLALEGRVQSRAYTKVVEGCAQERVAFEVSVMHLME
ncbi:MAG: single-stranded DNA-binding protein [Oscillospiraceae bacterium]|jgi:single-strand DNA-binding protein|nr:single-stranded DNA-binding protein [Oscillospiraceae bacterium]MCI8715350.1 single-stranded DNA-binding protein [Oscillospiraceae bacterium]MCI9317008.1 single-stranded DNA-binding protein [Oscillospiraceae bacterium]MDE6935977.1 single-stranded DNA-binding protein [Oscillospiraceae bacterium]